MISHDRFFISKIVNRIIEIKNLNFQSFDGDYEYYLEKKKNKKAVSN